MTAKAEHLLICLYPSLPPPLSLASSRDNNLRQLMDNESIGDMTLPPLPQFDGGGPGENDHSSTSSSSSDSDNDDDDDYDEGWSGDEVEPLAYGEEQVRKGRRKPNTFHKGAQQVV